MILSFAGHFDLRTTGPSPDILRFRRTFHAGRKWKHSQDIFNIQTENWISSPDILLNFLSLDILSSKDLPLRWTFENFAWHVQRDRWISHTLIVKRNKQKGEAESKMVSMYLPNGSLMLLKCSWWLFDICMKVDLCNKPMYVRDWITISQCFLFSA